jgi:hypothetical protein
VSHGRFDEDWLKILREKKRRMGFTPGRSSALRVREMFI